MAYTSISPITAQAATQYGVNPNILNFQVVQNGLASPGDIATLAQSDANYLSGNGGSYTNLLSNWSQSSGQPIDYDTANGIIDTLMTGSTNVSGPTNSSASNTNSNPQSSGILGSFLNWLNAPLPASGQISGVPTAQQIATNTVPQSQGFTNIQSVAWQLLAVIIGVVLLIGAFLIYKK